MASATQDKTLAAITQLASQREERRKAVEDFKKRRANEAKELLERGKFGDSDFVGMIERFRESSKALRNKRTYQPGDGKINVAVRKRPVSEREQMLLDYDTVTCANPFVIVHACKTRVDGITKNLENTQFSFDNAFDENASNDDVYNATCLPLVEFVALQDGRSTVFAYGQTGSGKTYTMQGLQERVARDIFRYARSRATHDSIVRIKCSNFELYGSQCIDLLNDRRQCAVREDGQGEIHIDGLKEEEAADEDEFLEILQRGASVRTTRSTEMNADSSRSHAIFQVVLTTGGKLSLIDLAGSERGQDVKNHDHTRRVESSAINKSLLALKECIRALDPASGATHVPYRQSKLTMVLKDSFAPESRTVMISCVSPAASSSDHTLNTLRYADRVKAKGASSGSQGQYREPQVSFTSLKSPGVTGRKSTGFSGKPGVSNLQQNSSTGLRAKSPAPLRTLNNTTKPAAGNSTTLLPKGIASPSKRGRYPAGGAPRQSSNLNASAISNVSHLETSTYSVASSKSELLSMSYERNSIVDDYDEAEASSDDQDDGENFLPPSGRRVGQQPIRSSTIAASPEGLPLSARKPATESYVPPGSSVGPNPVSVYALLDEEEALLDTYSQAVQQNFRIITEESNLLTEIESVVDYDIEVYTEKLRLLLEQKLKIFGELHTKLLVFQDHLRLEEQYAVGALKRET